MLVYRIYHKESGKSYVGQTVHPTFNRRYSGGRWWDITDNPILRSAYAKYGADAFAVEILESNVESLDCLNQLEEIYADRFNAYAPRGYNLRKCGDNRRLLPHQVEMIRKVKAKTYTLRKVDTWELVEVTNLKAFCRAQGITSGSMYNMVSENLGIIVAHGYCLPKRTREEVADRACRSYRGKTVTLVHESGEIATITSVKLFAQKWGLEMGTLFKVLRGESLYYRGWRLPDRVGEATTSEGEYELVAPDGSIHRGTGIARFCKEHGLRYGSIIRVISGNAVDHRGWRLPSTTKEQLVMKKRRLKIALDLIDPFGTPVHTDNLRLFCEERGLPYEGFYNLSKGYCQSTLGWTKAGGPRKRRKLVSPDGVVYEIANMRAFCRDQGLHYGCMTNMLAGNRPSSAGWRLAA